MKRIIVVILMCVLGINLFGQSWNTINRDLNECKQMKIDYDPYRIYGMSDVKYMPSVVYNRYQFGEHLMISGWINFGVGLTFAAIGGILLSAKEGQTPRQIKAGYAFCGIGGTLVSVSIPLLCFGDNAKREANVDYEMFNLQYKQK